MYAPNAAAHVFLSVFTFRVESGQKGSNVNMFEQHVDLRHLVLQVDPLLVWPRLHCQLWV